MCHFFKLFKHYGFRNPFTIPTIFNIYQPISNEITFAAYYMRP